jgi:hypothetical protein
MICECGIDHHAEPELEAAVDTIAAADVEREEIRADVEREHIEASTERAEDENDTREHVAQIEADAAVAIAEAHADAAVAIAEADAAADVAIAEAAADEPGEDSAGAGEAFADDDGVLVDEPAADGSPVAISVPPQLADEPALERGRRQSVSAFHARRRAGR